MWNFNEPPLSKTRSTINDPTALATNAAGRQKKRETNSHNPRPGGRNIVSINDPIEHAGFQSVWMSFANALKAMGATCSVFGKFVPTKRPTNSAIRRSGGGDKNRQIVYDKKQTKNKMGRFAGRFVYLYVRRNIFGRSTLFLVGPFVGLFVVHAAALLAPARRMAWTPVSSCRRCGAPVEESCSFAVP